MIHYDPAESILLPQYDHSLWFQLTVYAVLNANESYDTNLVDQLQLIGWIYWSQSATGPASEASHLGPEQVGEVPVLGRASFSAGKWLLMMVNDG